MAWSPQEEALPKSHQMHVPVPATRSRYRASTSLLPCKISSWGKKGELQACFCHFPAIPHRPLSLLLEEPASHASGGAFTAWGKATCSLCCPWSRYVEDHAATAPLLEGTSDTPCPPSCSQRGVTSMRSGWLQSPDPPPRRVTPHLPRLLPTPGEGGFPTSTPKPPGCNSGPRHLVAWPVPANTSVVQPGILRDRSWGPWDTGRGGRHSKDSSPTNPAQRSCSCRPWETLLSVLLRLSLSEKQRQKAFLWHNITRIACKFKGRALPRRALSSAQPTCKNIRFVKGSSSPRP